MEEFVRINQSFKSVLPLLKNEKLPYGEALRTALQLFNLPDNILVPATDSDIDKQHIQAYCEKAYGAFNADILERLELNLKLKIYLDLPAKDVGRKVKDPINKLREQKDLPKLALTQEFKTYLDQVPNNNLAEDNQAISLAELRKLFEEIDANVTNSNNYEINHAVNLVRTGISKPNAGQSIQNIFDVLSNHMLSGAEKEENEQYNKENAAKNKNGSVKTMRPLEEREYQRCGDVCGPSLKLGLETLNTTKPEIAGKFNKIIRNHILNMPNELTVEQNELLNKRMKLLLTKLVIALDAENFTKQASEIRVRLFGNEYAGDKMAPILKRNALPNSDSNSKISQYFSKIKSYILKPRPGKGAVVLPDEIDHKKLLDVHTNLEKHYDGTEKANENRRRYLNRLNKLQNALLNLQVHDQAMKDIGIIDQEIESLAPRQDLLNTYNKHISKLNENIASDGIKPYFSMEQVVERRKAELKSIQEQAQINLQTVNEELMALSSLGGEKFAFESTQRIAQLRTCEGICSSILSLKLKDASEVEAKEVVLEARRLHKEQTERYKQLYSESREQNKSVQQPMPQRAY